VSASPTADMDAAGDVVDEDGLSDAETVAGDQVPFGTTDSSVRQSACEPVATHVRRAACAGASAAVARGLWPGSADPHGVCDAVGGAVAPRIAAVRMAAHVAATPVELAARAFPAANVAPPTSPLPPPQPQPSGAPVVTRREQVAPASTWRLVRRWQRQLRRCFRAAERGNAGLARRLRPADLWLDHAAHSCAATAAWDWDMRPLEHGEPAVPLPISGVAGAPPRTSIVLPAVCAARADGGFVDLAILDEMERGVSDDSACRRGTLLCAPHAGALRELSIAVGKAEGDVSSGWADGGHGWLPCWPLRSCPYSIVDESVRAGRAKWRLTIDLSWPHDGMMADGGGGVDSVNGGMDRAAWPPNRLVRVMEYAEALELLRGGDAAPRRVRAWSLDCEAYYRAVGRQRRELWRNAIFLPSGVRLDERCCFGDAAAATKCSRISNFLTRRVRLALAAFDAAHPTRDAEWLEWQAARRAAAVAAGCSSDEVDEWCSLAWFAMYIDDAMAGSADDLVFNESGAPVLGDDGVQRRRASVHFDIARRTLESFGWSSAISKEQPPGLEVEALGVLVSLVGGGSVRLSGAKRQRYGKHVLAAAASASISSESLLRLVGRLQFAAQMYPVGRQHLHALWRAARVSSRRRDGAVALGRGALRELAWWRRELAASEHVGVPLASCGAFAPTAAGSTALYADASDVGFAAWCAVERPEGSYVIMLDGLWSAAERACLTIADRELLASTWALVAFAPWSQSRVTSFSDNTVAEAAMSSTAPRAPVAQLVAARRTQWLFEHAVVECAARVTTKANLWADVGSRPDLGGAAEVARQALRLGRRVLHVAVPASWRDTADLTGGSADSWCA
jgi:hypothetical protein